MTYRLEELEVRAIDSVLLVGVDLPGLGFPPHSSGRSSSKDPGIGSNCLATVVVGELPPAGAQNFQRVFEVGAHHEVTMAVVSW